MIEQAKGKPAERLSIDMDHAFTMLRDNARNSNQRRTDVARIFVEGATADIPAPASHEIGAAHQNQPVWPDSARS